MDDQYDHLSQVIHHLPFVVNVIKIRTCFQRSNLVCQMSSAPTSRTTGTPPPTTGWRAR